MAMVTPRRTMIVEDDPDTRARFVATLEAMPELEIAATAGGCSEARACFERELPELLVTDLGLPDGSGIDLISELRRRSPKSEIVVITVFGDERNVIRSIEAGASGYLLKAGEAEDLQRSMRELLDGGSPVSPAIARHLLRRFRSEPPPAQARAATSPFSSREREVLTLAAKGFTFPEIGEILGVTAHTVTTHMRRIYRKLEVSSKGEAIYEAVNQGLLTLEDD